MSDGELACPDLAVRPIDLDLRDAGDARAVALRIRDATALHLRAGLVAPRRGPRLPVRFLRCRLDQRDVARILDVAQPELDRIEIEGSRHLVDERLAREVD